MNHHSKLSSGVNIFDLKFTNYQVGFYQYPLRIYEQTEKIDVSAIKSGRREQSLYKQLQIEYCNTKFKTQSFNLINKEFRIENV